MIASDTPENSTNFTSNSAAALTVTQRSAHADGMPVVVVIGDGQSARMMQTEATELGQSIRLLASSPDVFAVQVCADVIIGNYHVWKGVERVVADAQAAAFDHEHVPTELLNKLIETGHSAQSQPSALLHAQDKLLTRQRLEELGAPIPAYAAIESVQDAETFFDRVDGAACLKACRGGCDGHGVRFPKDRENLRTPADELLDKDVPLMAERKVALVRELSAMCARTPSEEVKAWPVLGSVQRDGICVEVICPAPGLSDELASAAEKLSMAIASELGIAGALVVKLSEIIDVDGNPETFVNELTMCPHNTDHWSQDGRETSQLEQYLCAVADLPLGSTRPTALVIMMVSTLGGEEASDVPIAQRFAEVWRRSPSIRIHWHGKDWRLGRKLGHVSLCGYDASPEGIVKIHRIANPAASYIVGGVWTDGDPANDA